MKKTIYTLLAVLISYNVTISQDILFTIDNHKISKTEFERIYLKNNKQAIKPSDIDEYLQLFINYKLKVIDAKEQGYDTTQKFKDEYNEYYLSLAEPFFIDTILEEKLLKEAYERSKKERRISYMYFTIENQDTLSAYKKAQKAAKRAIAGEDFVKIASEMSDSKYVNLDKADAWFSPVFILPYELENYIYNNKIGDISPPIRYQDLIYYVIKITGERTEVPTSVRASHIYVRLTKKHSEKDSIEAMLTVDSIQTALKNGMSFEEAAEKFSQDYNSARKKGDLGWFVSGKMLREFETAVYEIKNIGEYTGPIKTLAGLHFIKLTGRKTLKPYAEERKVLYEKLKRNYRHNLTKDIVISRLKKEYNYKQINNLEKFYQEIDNSILSAKWENTKFIEDKTPLFSFAGITRTNKDFAEFLTKNQKRTIRTTVKKYINKEYDAFVRKNIKDYEITQLPLKNENYKYLMQEYHDGLMLFNITDDKVWTKSTADSTKLRQYYNENRNKYTEKINITAFEYTTNNAKNKLLKILSKNNKLHLTDKEIINKINKKQKLVNIAETGTFEKNDNKIADLVIEKMQNNQITNQQKIIIDPENKKIIYIKDNLPAIKGIVTSDYQNKLEKEWITLLKQKHKININKKVVEKMKSEIKKH